MNPTEQVMEILQRTHYPKDARYMLAAIQDIHRELGFLPKECEATIAEWFGQALPETLSQMTSFRHSPKADHVVEQCIGAVCSLKKIAGLRSELPFEYTHCLGACDQAPCARVNGKIITLSQESLDQISKQTSFASPEV